MATIEADYGTGGSGLAKGAARHPLLADVLRDMAADLLALKGEEGVSRGNALVVDVADLRTKFISTLAKLDADAGVTDVNYAALASPAALTAVAGVSSSALIAQLNALRVDLAAFRTAFIVALAKLDLDATVTATNYASLHTPAALTAVAITTMAEVPDAINALRADRAALVAKDAAVLAKLDAEVGVTDVNYAALGTPAAPTAGALTALLTIAG